MIQSLAWIESNLQFFYKRIYQNTAIDSSVLSYYRIFLGFFCLINFKSYSWLGGIPDSLFKPDVLNPAIIFDGFPSTFFFTSLDILSLVLLICIILGIKARISLLSYFLIICTQFSFLFSFGKIDHAILYMLIFPAMAFTNSGSYFAILPDKKLSLTKISIAIYSLCIVFAFFTAGYEKALNWVDLDLNTSGILSWYYAGYLNFERDQFLAKYFMNAPYWLTEFMDYGAVIFELSGIIFLLKSRKSWYIYLVAAVIFHLLNTFILNIPFTGHLIVYGIWLLSPFLKTHHLLSFLLLFGFLIPELWRSLYLAAIVIILSLRERFYIFK